MSLFGRIGAGLISGANNLNSAQSNTYVLVTVTTRQPSAEQLADAVLESLKVSAADRDAYRQANNGVDVRDQLSAEYRKNGIDYAAFEYAGKGQYRATVAMPQETHQRLVALSKTDGQAAPETTGAVTAKQHELRTQGALSRHQLEVKLRTAEAKQQIADSLLGQGGTQIAGAAIARELPKAVPKLGAGAVGAILALPAAVTLKEMMDMAIERQVELNIARDVPASPPPSQEMPPLPLLPPMADTTDKLRSTTPPTLAAPPGVATSTPPFANNQPLPLPPPMVTPIKEQSAQDLMYAASMSKQLADNMTAAGIARPANVAAHHIVAWDKQLPSAIESRRILTGFGIDINAAANGVFLPDKAAAVGVAPGMYHRTLHTDKYFNTVRDRLNEATTKEEAIEILDEIRNQLLKGTFPIK